MSYLPREEQPLSVSYPDLDIHSPITIETVRPNEPAKHADTYMTPSAPTDTPLAVQSAPGALMRASSPDPAPFGVPARIGGGRTHPAIRCIVSRDFGPSALELAPPNAAPRPVPEGLYQRPDSALQMYEPFVRPHFLGNLDFDALLAAPAAASAIRRVEYDLDEQDAAFLGHIHVRFGTFLSADHFELAMSLLNCCAAALIARMAVLESSSGDKKAPLDENDHCCIICNSPDFNDSNSILFCDGCDISVHQDCYGVPNIPEGFWFCRRCEAMREHGELSSAAAAAAAGRCELCPMRFGAFKRTQFNLWVHMVCALYHPSVRVPPETGLLEPVQNLELVDPSRYALKCFICNEKRGACLQCAARGCFKPFHASCARLAGLLMYDSGTDMQETLLHQAALPVYCDRHSISVNSTAALSSSISSSSVQDGILRVRELLRRERERLKAPQPSLFAVARIGGTYWRTPQSKTLVLPHAVVRPVQEALRRRAGIECSQNLVEFLCRYWTIKRDLADGVMLDRRLGLAAEIAALRVARPTQPESHTESPENMLKTVEALRRLFQKPQQRTIRLRQTRQRAERAGRASNERASSASSASNVSNGSIANGSNANASSVSDASNANASNASSAVNADASGTSQTAEKARTDRKRKRQHQPGRLSPRLPPRLPDGKFMSSNSNSRPRRVRGNTKTVQTERAERPARTARSHVKF